MLGTIKKLVAQNNFTPVEILRLRAGVQQFELGHKKERCREYLANLILWSDYSDERLIDIGVEADCFCMGLIARHLSLLGISNDERIRLGKKANDRSVWSKVAETLELDGVSNLQLIKLARKVGEQQAWPRIANALNLENLSNANLLKLAKVANNMEVTELVSTKLQLQNLTDDELIDIGQGFSFHCIEETFWGPVLDSIFSTRNRIEQLIEFGKKAENSKVWSLILQRKDRYLKTDRLLEIGRAAHDSFVWAHIGNVVDLKKADIEQLLEIGVGSKGYHNTWKRFIKEFSTRRLSNQEVIAIANTADDYNVEEWARETLKIKGKNKAELIELGKESRDWQIWHKLLPQLA